MNRNPGRIAARPWIFILIDVSRRFGSIEILTDDLSFVFLANNVRCGGRCTAPVCDAIEGAHTARSKIRAGLLDFQHFFRSARLPGEPKVLTGEFNTVIATCNYRRFPIYRGPHLCSKLCPNQKYHVLSL